MIEVNSDLRLLRLQLDVASHSKPGDKHKIALTDVDGNEVVSMEWITPTPNWG